MALPKMRWHVSVPLALAVIVCIWLDLPAVESFATTILPTGFGKTDKSHLLDASSFHRPYYSTSTTRRCASNYEYALLFDCDGVILETEELHRLAYNEAFQEFDLTIDDDPVMWSVEYYDMLQNTVGGGKPKMFFHFRNTTKSFPMVGGKAPPTTAEEQQALIDGLQTFKTAAFKRLLATEAKPRPGVLRLMDEALADSTIGVGVCSASTKEAAQTTLQLTLGPERVDKLDVCILGDDVATKKPDPLIYNVARQRLQDLPASKCVVIEDSLIGLQAAKGAGMRCVITYTDSTSDMDFYGQGADAKVPDLESAGVTLASIFDPMRAEGTEAELLVGTKDAMEVTVK